jgi:hypothetical protein
MTAVDERKNPRAARMATLGGQQQRGKRIEPRGLPHMTFSTVGLEIQLQMALDELRQALRQIELAHE